MNPFTARCVKDEEYRCLISGTMALVPLVVGVIHGRIYLATTNTPARMVLVAGSTQEEVLMQGTFAAVEPVWEDETGQEFNLVDLTRPGSLASNRSMLTPAAPVPVSGRCWPNVEVNGNGLLTRLRSRLDW
jgi:membrane-associated PAP2 superfamily phosphatase